MELVEVKAVDIDLRGGVCPHANLHANAGPFPLGSRCLADSGGYFCASIVPSISTQWSGHAA